MVTGMAAIHKYLDTPKADEPFMKISKDNLMAPKKKKKKVPGVQTGNLNESPVGPCGNEG